MVKTTVFNSNRTQAVRLPKAVALPESVRDIDVVAVGNRRIITPSGYAWDEWFEQVDVSADFMPERDEPEAQSRELFDD